MEEPRTGKQKAFALIGGAAVVVGGAGLGIYAFLTAMVTPLHTDAAGVASVVHTTPLATWSRAVAQGRQRARAGLVERNLPGLSVAVGVGGEVVWAEGFGWADLEKRVPVAPNLRFRIGHVSTTLTSAAVGQLLEEGRLNLDDEIQTYVPAFPPKQWSVTLRQLMGHVAGVRHYESEAHYMPTERCERASDWVPRFAGDPLRFQPEAEYSYSTFGWILVSAAVEAAAKEPFFTVVRGRILEPLGMRDTTHSAADSVPNLVTVYSPRLSGDPQYGFAPAARVDYSCFAGAGAFLSTPSDLVRFGMAMNGGKLLEPETLSLLHTKQRLLSGEETQSGLGWNLEEFPLAGESTPAATQASRTLLGSSTSFMTFPERGIAVAVMSNTDDASLWPIALSIAQAFAETGG